MSLQCWQLQMIQSLLNTIDMLEMHSMLSLYECVVVISVELEEKLVSVGHVCVILLTKYPS